MSTRPSLPRIGFVGLGSQGAPIARRIVDAGFPLTLWARRSESYAPFADTASDYAGSIAELGSSCEFVAICVIDDAGVQTICEELMPAMRPGGRIAVHSTILPETCLELSRRCAERRLGFVDAPVSGGGGGAQAGTLTVMCGGAPADFEAFRPVFETFGKLIVRLGDVGAGQRAKLVNNALMAAHMGLAQAALSAGDALDVDRNALADLIKASSGRSFGFEVFSRMPQPLRAWPGGSLLTKDVGLLMAALPADPAVGALADAAHLFLDALPKTSDTE